ncbi:hypothetical protein L3V77_11930 [Vibrio sp. DW001]|uniref:hypothetical protein n=1 Tax=Vibrio sp. DW001 TaxID=2912315 RepID=UPI0023B0F4BE|nr:hypothetical protein [Vibrio sp. DW001]WED25760.1 hypothetical protein L3V77_11930 [Vibrio sp. DW001]
MTEQINGNNENELISSILDEKLTIYSMTDDELSRFRGVSKSGSLSTELLVKLQQKILTPVVKSYNDVCLSQYFSNDSDISSDKWDIRFQEKGVNKLTLDFNVIMYDGQMLTSPKHSKLLDIFKWWLLVPFNSMYTGGKQYSGGTLYIYVRAIASWIDSILYHQKSLNLCERHMSSVNEDFCKAVLVDYGMGKYIGSRYNFYSDVSSLLKESALSVSEADLNVFEKRFPPICSTDKCLHMTELDIRKSRCWLFNNGYYGQGRKHYNYNYTFKQYPDLENMKSNYCIYNNAKYISPPELLLYESDDCSTKEFEAVDVRVESEFRGSGAINNLLYSLRFLFSVELKIDNHDVRVEELSKIELNIIRELVNSKPAGRFNTLPVNTVFKAIGDAFSFSLKNSDGIFNSMYNVIFNLPTKVSVNDRNTLAYRRGAVTDYIFDDVKILGVKEFSITGDTQRALGNNYFSAIRNNHSFIDLYRVSIGSMILLVGALMARRVTEIIDLDLKSCLSPDSNPNLSENIDVEYYLNFQNQKSGVSTNTKKGRVKDSLSRPIPRSLAKLIYNYKTFAMRLLELCGVKYKTNNFLVSVNPTSMKAFFTSKNQCGINSYLDYFCDYFQTEIITQDDGQVYRYYIRTHQLRRFFAMVFFWSKNNGGLETLRHMLGHTDIRHVYNYITEKTTGGVLNGIKAHYIRESYKDGDIEVIDKLRSVLKLRYNTDSLEIATLSEATNRYDNEDYTTSPEFKDFDNSKQEEELISNLLKDGAISLDFEFFTVEDELGKYEDYRIVLKVFEDFCDGK